MDRRSLLRAGGAAGLLLALTASALRAEEAKPLHRIALQVSSADPALMNLALTNIVNIAKHYAGTGDSVAIDLTAFGPGYAMVRADTSPVRARIAEIRQRYPFVRFSACQNARRAMAEAEGKTPDAIPQIAEADDVPAGVVHLSELQEQGWSYLRP
ncbi:MULTISPECIES: DsrE family protein [Methylobacterium]|uniref:DsrE/DsrF-like family protein n=1 Tax=Methylobacterium thuringiense TaxID=1003091 RepID=A0ABQ4TM06_9HYPH|nr:MULTISPECIES: hypothetical protein [Methylobacterium]TXN22975.1 hypothetical protein FV217_08580 [Methylobacterium sp. WL9]GJE55617.1 hypothetical protein EKPJFOCH_2112 [Methylobacterium thuringiense]